MNKVSEGRTTLEEFARHLVHIPIAKCGCHYTRLSAHCNKI